jgi:hypothetical protein
MRTHLLNKFVRFFNRECQTGKILANMNRIYQGKVTAVEIPDGKDEQGKPKWKRIANCDWRRTLREQHEIFQDGVNYYFVALAAMAEGLKPAKEDERDKKVISRRSEARGRKARSQRGKGHLYPQSREGDAVRARRFKFGILSENTGPGLALPPGGAGSPRASNLEPEFGS